MLSLAGYPVLLLLSLIADVQGKRLSLSRVANLQGNDSVQHGEFYFPVINPF